MIGRYRARCFSDCENIGLEPCLGFVCINATHLVHRHELVRGILLSLGQRHKLNVLWWSRFVPERRLDGIEVVCTDRDKLPSPTKVLMQLVLKVDEGLVGTLGELHVAKNGAGKEGTNLLRLESVDGIGLGRSAGGNREMRTSLLTVAVMRSASPPGGYASLYCGGLSSPRKQRMALAIPSMQRRSYL